MWRLARSRGAATLTIELFASVREREREALAAEADRVLAFGAPGAAHDIRFAPLVPQPS
jgi:hypothetical protein